MICRACGQSYGHDYSETGDPQVTGGAHIKSRGAGGKKTMKLCHTCHTEQHRVGIATFVKRHPNVIEYYPELGRYI